MLWRLRGCALRCAAVSRALFFPRCLCRISIFPGSPTTVFKMRKAQDHHGCFHRVHCPRACSEIKCLRGRLAQRPACLSTTRWTWASHGQPDSSCSEISLTRTLTHELHLPFPTSIKSTAPWAAAGLDAGQGVSDLLGPGFEEVVASIGSGHCLFWPSWLASAPKPVYFHRSGSMPHTSSDPEARPIQKTRDATAMQIV